MSQAEPPATPQQRVIDLSVEVAGTPQEVWTAIATGPGISSWYVPTTVEEHQGGATTSRFGEGPEMLIPGCVTAWEPPHRVVFEGAEGGPGMAFEWLVEARDGGSCVVRLVNSGFVAGTPWDDQYDGMAEGWRLFLHNLQLHLAHFPGEVATAMLPVATWSATCEAAWSRLTTALGVASAPQPGDRITPTATDVPPLAGIVVEAEPWRVSILLDEPAPGTAFIACEGVGDQTGVSVWQYLYGAAAADVISRDQPRWQDWLERHTS